MIPRGGQCPFGPNKNTNRTKQIPRKSTRPKRGLRKFSRIYGPSCRAQPAYRYQLPAWQKITENRRPLKTRKFPAGQKFRANRRVLKRGLRKFSRVYGPSCRAQPAYRYQLPAWQKITENRRPLKTRKFPAAARTEFAIFGREVVEVGGSVRTAGGSSA